MNKKKLGFHIILYVVVLLAVWLTSASIVFGIHAIKKDGTSFGACLGDKITWIVTGVIYLIFIGFVLYNKFIKNIGKAKMKVERNKESNLHDNSRFLEKREMMELYGNNDDKKNPKMKSWKNIKNEIVNGMVVQSYTEKGDLKLLSASDLHSLIVGTTGMGKTKFLIIPTIECMLASKNKPSIVQLDVKGEIEERTKKNALKNGYQTFSIDLRNTGKSNKFNPFYLVMFYYKKYLESDKTDMKALEQSIHLIKAITEKFKQQGNDAFWSNAPAQLIETYIWSLIENYEYCSFYKGTPFLLPENETEQDPVLLKACKKLTNFGKLSGVSFRAIEDISTFSAEELYKYFERRDTKSNTYKLANSQVLSSISVEDGEDGNKVYTYNQTFRSILQTYSNSYNDIMGKTLLTVTDGNDLDLEAMYLSPKPFIVYLLMPDEDKSKYPFATLIISFIYEFYTTLSQEFGFGGKYKGKRKDVHFIMDEFANLSKLDAVDNWLSVGRERRLFSHLFVQGLSQLNEKYGAEKTKTIIGNCNMKIFMAVSENEVIDYAVKLFGTYTVSQSSVSFGQGGGGGSVSAQLGQANLVNAGELKQLPKGTIYFLETTKFPCKSTVLGSFTNELKTRFGYTD